MAIPESSKFLEKSTDEQIRELQHQVYDLEQKVEELEDQLQDHSRINTMMRETLEDHGYQAFGEFVRAVEELEDQLDQNDDIDDPEDVGKPSKSDQFATIPYLTARGELLQLYKYPTIDEINNITDLHNQVKTEEYQVLKHEFLGTGPKAVVSLEG